MKEEKRNRRASSSKKENRLSANDMAMRLTTLPLHSFLTGSELNLYYVLDRFPIRSRFGLEDKGVRAVLSRIMGSGDEEFEKAAAGLVDMGFVIPAGTDTSWMESVLDFPAIYEFCIKLGRHGVGFGAFLRKVTGSKPILQISSRDFGMAENAYRAMEDNAHTHVGVNNGVFGAAGAAVEDFGDQVDSL